jgi:hypothetical protein
MSFALPSELSPATPDLAAVRRYDPLPDDGLEAASFRNTLLLEELASSLE